MVSGDLTAPARTPRHNPGRDREPETEGAQKATGARPEVQSYAGETPKASPGEQQETTRIITGIREFTGLYDAFIVDVWGVIHNGGPAFPDAIRALRKLRRKGRPVLLLSNAPRPASLVSLFLNTKTDGREPFHDGLLTSGDIALGFMERFSRLDFSRMLHIGQERDLPLVEAFGFSLAARPEEADFVFCTGLWDDRGEVPESYMPLLSVCRKRNCPMLCANPDLAVIHGDVVVPCAGAIAQLYERIGGKVIWLGKPHALAYDAAMERLGKLSPGLSRNRVLAVGDSFRTDIAGARNNGLDALFVSGGIEGADPAQRYLPDTGQLTAESLDAAVFRHNVRPNYAIDSLRW